MNWQLFAAFLLITMVLILMPGPIVTLVIATSVTKGVRAGLVTVAGTTAGNIVLLAVIVGGLSFVLEHALYWFDVLRFAGAAYLIWLGIKAWHGAGAAPPPPRDHVQFGRGFLVALFNPKTIAFFSAFLPQFIDPNLPAARQLAVMCAVSALLAALSDAAYAVLAGLGRTWFMHPARTRLLGRVSGFTLIGGGIWLSLSRRPA
jgi:threonine/homoserine/homoserine lactone efflux protein